MIKELKYGDLTHIPITKSGDMMNASRIVNSQIYKDTIKKQEELIELSNQIIILIKRKRKHGIIKMKYNKCKMDYDRMVSKYKVKLTSIKDTLIFSLIMSNDIFKRNDSIIKNNHNKIKRLVKDTKEVKINGRNVIISNTENNNN